MPIIGKLLLALQVRIGFCRDPQLPCLKHGCRSCHTRAPGYESHMLLSCPAHVGLMVEFSLMILDWSDATLGFVWAETLLLVICCIEACLKESHGDDRQTSILSLTLKGLSLDIFRSASGRIPSASGNVTRPGSFERSNRCLCIVPGAFPKKIAYYGHQRHETCQQ